MFHTFRLIFRRFVPVTARLSITAAAEHYTASLVYLILSNERIFLKQAHPLFKAVLLYHAMEEIEHKSVCFQLYQCISGNYLCRFGGFVFSTIDLFVNIYLVLRYLLWNDGLWGFKQQKAVIKLIFGKNGIVKVLIHNILRYLKPSFHPWNTDERAFIKKRVGLLLSRMEEYKNQFEFAFFSQIG